MALSEQEDEELERQLLLINKPAVTTIHTEYGDIIDCVDFYKQPAFDHPLLKNHTFHYQMKPISVHRGTRDQVSSKSTEPVSLGLKGGGCPVGTVPIRRITKGDLIRDRLASKITSLEDNSPDTHYAVVRTRANSNKKFIGAGARISVEAPNDIEYRQYSAAKMKIQNGPDSIEVGWRPFPISPCLPPSHRSNTGLILLVVPVLLNGEFVSDVLMSPSRSIPGWIVRCLTALGVRDRWLVGVVWLEVDPSLYGDSLTRLFIRLDAGQSHCFNTRCPGFIIVRSDIPLDVAFDHVSYRGGPFFYLHAYIIRDQANGNWWLEVGLDNTQIGFWPSRLFTGLGDLANHLEWGGEAFGPPGTYTPPMGRNFFPSGAAVLDASIRQILALNEYGQTVDIDNLEEYSDNNNLYKVYDRGNFGEVPGGKESTQKGRLNLGHHNYQLCWGNSASTPVFKL
ncbi:hypothetical protein Vadar_027988 [Vaccinium darrowii]|uniref:Uncharacterized protein n=1 Tax=Vaccinium darrowii TaxID=229202 RepID=A0ACB7XV72_9ERIC|nr:hypothetical protein Vadar_027988 [Vaccinium darrowii]